MGGVAEVVPPTAHAVSVDRDATPNRLTPPGGLGLRTRFQAVPFQRTIRVQPTVGQCWLMLVPAAHAFAADVAVTPYRLPRANPWCRTRVHAVPFHRSAHRAERRLCTTSWYRSCVTPEQP